MTTWQERQLRTVNLASQNCIKFDQFHLLSLQVSSASFSLAIAIIIDCRFAVICWCLNSFILTMHSTLMCVILNVAPAFDHNIYNYVMIIRSVRWMSLYMQYTPQFTCTNIGLVTMQI